MVRWARERDVITMKEYPEEVNESSVKRRNVKTNPVRKCSPSNHRLVASLIIFNFYHGSVLLYDMIVLLTKEKCQREAVQLVLGPES